MASRLNRHYNDPNLGAAFSNIAQMFKPPSGGEVYAYARARAAQEEAKRLSELYGYATDPNFDQTRFDRMGIAAGRYNPNQSFYSVDQGNATSRANNAADNRRALDVAGIQERGSTTRTLLGPVGQNATRFVPPPVAEAYGIPQTQVGVISASPGERVTAPDGRVIEGAAKPLSAEEQRAVFMRDLSPDEQRAVAFGSTPVETIVTPQGPQIATRPQSIGQTPVPDQTRQPTPVIKSYRTPAGGTGTMRLDPASGKFLDTQTGQEIPPGSIEIRAQGSVADVGATTANNTAATNREAELRRTLNTLDLYENLISQNPGAIGLPGLIRGMAQNAVQVGVDLTRSFGDKAPEMASTIKGLSDGLKGVAPELFDSSIPEAAFLQGTIAYAIARTENPSGEVSRQAYDRALERVRGGALANTASSVAAVGALRNVLRGEIEAIQTLRRPGNVPADTNLRPSAAGGATPREYTYNPATGRLE
jgi:hypothetical protein